MVEELTEKLTDKFRSEKFKINKGRECVKLGREFMRLKIQDEKAFHGEKMYERNKMRRGIMESMGENTRRTKTFIKCLRNEAMRVKNVVRERYDKKLRFLAPTELKKCTISFVRLSVRSWTSLIHVL